VPDEFNRPNELLQVYWLVTLVRSTAGAEGESRSYATGPIPAEFFTGNISLTALRNLTPCISRASDVDESDVFEFVNHFELKVCEWVKGLQSGTMSSRQVKKFRTTFEDYLKKVREHESMQVSTRPSPRRLRTPSASRRARSASRK
jgi:hypothetical protein